MKAVEKEWICTECKEDISRRQQQPIDVDLTRAPGWKGEEKSDLIVGQWNCDHLLAKIPELEVWLKERRIEIMMIQEMKMRAEDGTLRVFGYEVLRKDRKREGSSRYSRGGGVVILIRQGMPYKEINMMSIEK